MSVPSTLDEATRYFVAELANSIDKEILKELLSDAFDYTTKETTDTDK